ncbi:hypothetical protein F5051DRAFT_466728 [Lentinula edodes]|nr:hypothetical protein F5051DRAFT_466728 [Lentinula edodes]
MMRGSSMVLFLVIMISVMAKTIQSAPTPAEPVNHLDPVRVELLGKDLEDSGRNVNLSFLWILVMLIAPSSLPGSWTSMVIPPTLVQRINKCSGSGLVKQICFHHMLISYNIEKPLGKAVVGLKIDCKGYHNEGIYLLQGDYTNSKIPVSKTAVIVKVMDEVDNNALGEVRALKDVDLYIDSGMAIIHKKREPVILMGKVDGVSILNTVQFKDAMREGNEKEIDGWLEQMRPLVKEQVVFWALGKKRLLHADFNLGNIHIGARTSRSGTSQEVHFDYPIKKARVLDFGYPGIFKVSERVTKEQVVRSQFGSTSFMIFGADSYW